MHPADYDSSRLKPKVSSIDSLGIVEAQKAHTVSGIVAIPVNLRV